ncbi:MAG: VCBS repeat-containing protein [Chloroflexota bacterium]
MTTNHTLRRLTVTVVLVFGLLGMSGLFLTANNTVQAQEPQEVDFHMSWRAGIRANDLAWGDANHDGTLDLAIISESGSYIFLSHDGTLETLDDDPWVGPSGSQVAWADMDRDGALDFIVNLGVDGIQIYRNEGLDAQSKLIMTPTWHLTATGRMAVGDTNGDGWFDLIIYQSLYIHNTQDGEGLMFEEPIPLPIGPQEAPTDFELGDIDQDGDLDLLIIWVSPLDFQSTFALLRNENGVYSVAQTISSVYGYVNKTISV